MRSNHSFSLSTMPEGFKRHRQCKPEDRVKSFKCVIKSPQGRGRRSAKLSLVPAVLKTPKAKRTLASGTSNDGSRRSRRRDGDHSGRIRGSTSGRRDGSIHARTDLSAFASGDAEDLFVPFNLDPSTGHSTKVSRMLESVSLLTRSNRHQTTT